MQALASADARGPAVTQNLHLLRELIRRDFAARFTGSALGLFWAVLQPAILVAVYWFVFTFMFEARALGGEGYIFFLISGLLPWLAFNEGLMRALTCIVDNAPVVRKLPLRSELLVIVPNATAIIFEVVALVLFTGVVVTLRGFPRGIWLLPFALVLQFVLQIGISLFLAGAFVFFRDLGQLLGFVLSVVFYLSPILYPPHGRFEQVLAWNPLTPLLGLFRSAFLGAPLPELASIVFLLAATAAAAVAGMFFFRRVQPAVVDLV